MDKSELIKKMRQGAFRDNNGKVLRAINILRVKYAELKIIKYALEGMPENEFLDSINFLQEAGYIKLRHISSKTQITIEDVDSYELLEAKVTEKGIRLLGGEMLDTLVNC